MSSAFFLLALPFGIAINMTFRKIWLVVAAMLVVSAISWSGCTTKKKKLRKLENFDDVAWIQDKNGCNGDRMLLKDNLLASKYYMRGLKAEQIEEYLGKPDAQELYDRNQKYYIYFLEPGPKCADAKENPLGLFVRFTAVGIANEFTIKPL
jgi:hypothetical protein